MRAWYFVLCAPSSGIGEADAASNPETVRKPYGGENVMGMRLGPKNGAASAADTADDP